MDIEEQAKKDMRKQFEEIMERKRKIKSTFKGKLIPEIEFAEFMDEVAAEIRLKTPFDIKPTLLYGGNPEIFLGTYDNFKVYLQVSKTPRQFRASFRPTLDVGFKYEHQTCWHHNAARALNEGFNTAKMGMKNRIASKSKMYHHYLRLETNEPEGIEGLPVIKTGEDYMSDAAKAILERED